MNMNTEVAGRKEMCLGDSTVVNHNETYCCNKERDARALLGVPRLWSTCGWVEHYGYPACYAMPCTIVLLRNFILIEQTRYRFIVIIAQHVVS